MNFNEQQNRQQRSGLGKNLTRRPMETPGLNTNPSVQGIQQMYPEMGSPSYAQPMYPNNSFQNSNQPFIPGYPSVNMNQYSMPSNNSGFSFPGQTNILSDPLVTNVALNYGQALVGSGRQLVDKEINKYVPISQLKYYFAVDTAYVSKKLSIILFPYLHTDWSIKYDQNEPIQPKFEVNAPDLYIPTMAFVTYVLIVGLIFGTKKQFTPEKLSIEATSAMAWTALEVIIQLLTLYIANISTNLRTLDLISYSSYKYVGIIFTAILNLLLGHAGYIVCVSYVSISITFFLMRALKLHVLSEPATVQPDVYGIPQQSSHQLGFKRRRYFLLFVTCTQPIFMWWFTWRLL